MRTRRPSTRTTSTDAGPDRGVTGSTRSRRGRGLRRSARVEPAHHACPFDPPGDPAIDGVDRQRHRERAEPVEVLSLGRAAAGWLVRRRDVPRPRRSARRSARSRTLTAASRCSSVISPASAPAELGEQQVRRLFVEQNFIHVAHPSPLRARGTPSFSRSSASRADTDGAPDRCCQPVCRPGSNLVVRVAGVSAQHRQQQPASFTQASERRPQLLVPFGSHEKFDGAVVVEVEGAEQHCEVDVSHASRHRSLRAEWSTRASPATRLAE